MSAASLTRCRIVALVAIGLIARAAGAGQAPQVDGAVLYATVAPSVCTVLVDGELKGTGFVMADHMVCTNAHVVLNVLGSVQAVFGPTRVRAVVLMSDSASDVAFLALPSDSAAPPPLKLADGLPPAGQPVWAVGYDAGTLGGLAPGVVSGPPVYQTTDDPPRHGAYRLSIRTKVLLGPGSSGSPLVDSDGKVLGVHWGVKTGAGLGMSIPASRIAELLDWMLARLSETGASPPVTPPPYPYIGLMMRETWEGQPTAAAQRAVELLTQGPAEHSGVLVSSVLPNSPAASADIRPLDLVTAVNGTPVASVTDYASAVIGLAPGSGATLSEVRVENGTQAEHEVTLKVGDANKDVLTRYGSLYCDVSSARRSAPSKWTVSDATGLVTLRASVSNGTSQPLDGFRLALRSPPGIEVLSGESRLVDPVLNTSDPVDSDALLSPEGARLPTLAPTPEWDPSAKPGERQYVEIRLRLSESPPQGQDYWAAAFDCSLAYLGAECGRDYAMVARPG